MSKRAKRARTRRRTTNDGKRLERLTAALHMFKVRGGEVKWDETINGYQIDVTVRFQTGGYAFLMIIECRDRGRPATRDDVVILKNRQQATGANKAVLVSRRGFQSGAREYAAENEIELYTLQEIPADWPETTVAALPAFIGVRRMWIKNVGGDWIEIPEEQGLRYLSLARVSSAKGKRLTLNDAFQAFVPKDWRTRVGEWAVRVGFDGDWTLSIHGLPDRRVTAALLLVETLATSKNIVARRPPEQRPKDVVYRDERKEGSEVIASRDLPFGLNTVVQPGEFYRDIDGREYFFESVRGDDVFVVLLSSLQHGTSFFGAGNISLEDARTRYVRIDTSDDIERLKAALAIWRDAEAKGLTRVAGFIPDPSTGSVYVPLGFFD